MAEFGNLIKILKAAGEVTRLRLLALLAAGELSVKDLTDILDQSQPRVSRHLKLLSEAGLVTRNAEGAWVFYRLVDAGETGKLLHSFLGQLEDRDEVIAADRSALAKILDANQKQADAYFAKVAQSWDDLRKLHVAESAVETAILRMLGTQKVNRLLDFGTGTGRMLELLKDIYSFGVGIDSSPEMIAVARAKMSAAKISHAQIKLGDISGVEVAEPEANLLILHQVLHYFSDPGRILIEAQRQLVTGGRILVVDFAPHDLEFLREHNAHQRLGLSEKNMAAWATAAGLHLEKFESYANENQADGLVVCLWLFTKTQEGKIS